MLVHIYRVLPNAVLMQLRGLRIRSSIFADAWNDGLFILWCELQPACHEVSCINLLRLLQEFMLLVSVLWEWQW